MSPADQKKAELLKDPDFAKIVKSLKMKAPIQQIITKVKAEGRFKVEDVLLFATEGEVKRVQEMGLLGEPAKAPKSAAEAAAEKKERQERMAKAAIDKAEKLANKPMSQLEMV